MEVTQPTQGESLMMDFSRQHGQGVNHIHLKVDDLEKEKASYGEKGVSNHYEGEKSRWKDLRNIL